MAASVCASSVSAKTDTAAKKNDGGYLVAENHDYSQPVSASGAVANSFFNDAAFIGDSRGVDIILYSDLNKTKALPYCEVGLNISTVFTKKFINIDGKSYTALSALKKNKSKFSKVYLVFGLNELGYPSYDSVVKQYVKLVVELRNINPRLSIYVMGVLPVTKQKDSSDTTVNLKNICLMNAKLRAMCKSYRLFFIDAYPSFINAEGYLPSGVTSDGVHFSSGICGGWFEYLKAHTVNVENKEKKK